MITSLSRLLMDTCYMCFHWKTIHGKTFKIFLANIFWMIMEHISMVLCTGNACPSELELPVSLLLLIWQRRKFLELAPLVSITDYQRFMTGVLGGCICLLFHSIGIIKQYWFWIMKYYNVKESWTRILITPLIRFSTAIGLLEEWQDITGERYQGITSVQHEGW